MKRRMIKIDTERCNGCGLCATACHEGAIEMVEGKARLVKDDYCDGLGDCLPACPTGAISFELREAAAYDHQAVQQRLQQSGRGCPRTAPAPCDPNGSALAQWPVQLRLAPVTAPHYQQAHLLIAADCTAYAYCDFHPAFMQGRVTLIGCPKLDEADYAEKLTAILRENDIKDVTLVRMEVPCCGGLERALQIALSNCGKIIPCRSEIITLEGKWTAAG